jgi:hypothetical protein
MSSAADSAAATLSTGAMKRYPRRARVSRKRGLEAKSPSASRILFTAVFRL